MFQSRIQRKTHDQIELMRSAGLVVAHCLDELSLQIRPGVTTGDLDRFAADFLKANRATSSFLGYGLGHSVPPYPAVTCISVNDVVVHGIPCAQHVLEEGDLVSIDFGAIVDGWHADAARTFIVGATDATSEALVRAARESMWAGIAAMWKGKRIGDISAAIERSIRRLGNWGIVTDFTGHGIGTEMHQDPYIPNFGRPGRGAKLMPGMCLAIEPMVTAGAADVYTRADQWTVATRDGSRAAHWENTVAIEPEGLWVLTEIDGGREELAKLQIPCAALA